MDRSKIVNFIESKADTRSATENKILKLRRLEKHVRIMRRELRHIRQDMVVQEYLERLNYLSDRLKELNNILCELRNYYNRLQVPQKSKRNENVEEREQHFQHQQQSMVEERHLETRSQHMREMGNTYLPYRQKQEDTHFQTRPQKEGELIKESLINQIKQKEQNILQNQQPNPKVSELVNEKAPVEASTQLMEEIKPPSSILGDNLLRLQDFRTDPELRRRRLEKKQIEKLKQLQQKYSKTSIDNTQETPFEENGIKMLPGKNSVMFYPLKDSMQNYPLDLKPTQESVKTDQPSETQTQKCRIIEWNNEPIPNEIPRNGQQPDTSLVAKQISDSQQTFSSETQTDILEIPDLYITQKRKDHEDSQNKIVEYKNKITQSSSTCDTKSVSELSSSSSTQQSNSSSSLPKNLPLIRENLLDVVYSIIHNIDHKTIALTVVLETDNLYHINIAVAVTSQSLCCLYATEDAVQQAKYQNLFTDLLTFFIVNSDNTLAQKNRMLGHSFEIIKS